MPFRAAPFALAGRRFARLTVLARRLSVAELGAYGLVASLAGYLLALRNSIASSTVRAMAAAVETGERRGMFSTAAERRCSAIAALSRSSSLAPGKVWIQIPDGHRGSSRWNDR